MRNKTKILNKLQNAQATNVFIHRLRKIPFIKKLVRSNAYSNPTHKKVYMILSLTLFYVRKVVFYGIVATGGYFLSDWASTVLPIRFEDFYLLLMTVLLLLFRYTVVSFEDTDEKWRFIKIFRVPDDVVFFQSLQRHLTVRLIQGFILAASLFIRSPLVSIWVLIFSVSIMLLWEALSVRSFIKNKRFSRFKSWLLMWALLLVPIVGAIGNVTHTIVPLGALVLIGIAVVCFKYLWDHNVYSQINKYMQSSMKLSSDRVQEVNELRLENLRVDTNIDISKSKQYVDKYQGYRMLNHIFFMRHLRMWLKPLKRSLYIIGALGSVATIILAALKIFAFKEFSDISSYFNQNIFSVLSAVVVFMGFTNVTSNVTQSLYLNADYSLLHYAFYRRKETIWKQYLSRIYTLVVIDLIPALALCFLLVIFGLIGLVDFNLNFLLLTADIIMVSVFLTVFYLFLYYILQPFNKNIEVKSILYSLLQGALYYFMYSGSAIVKFLGQHSLIFLGTVLAFIVISTVCVYFFAPKTFKVREV